METFQLRQMAWIEKTARKGKKKKKTRRPKWRPWFLPGQLEFWRIQDPATWGSTINHPLIH